MSEHDDAVVVECDLDAPLDRVWTALTDPGLVETWLAPREAGVELGEMRDVEPGRRLSYDWREAEGAGLDSVVTFTLTETEDGVRLRIVHEPVSAPVSVLAWTARPARPRAVAMPARRCRPVCLCKAA
jgi:uncharacterized protein YndB with AHSA1/START domain